VWSGIPYPVSTDRCSSDVNAPGRRTLLSQETRIGAEYEWICDRGHSHYLATVRAALTGSGCPKCRANAEAPAARFEGGTAAVEALLIV